MWISLEHRVKVILCSLWLLFSLEILDLMAEILYSDPKLGFPFDLPV